MGEWETLPALLSLASVKRTRNVTRSSLSSTNNTRSNKEHRFVVAQPELALARAASYRDCKHSDVLSGVSRVCLVKLNPRDYSEFRTLPPADLSLVTTAAFTVFLRLARAAQPVPNDSCCERLSYGKQRQACPSRQQWQTCLPRQLP